MSTPQTAFEMAFNDVFNGRIDLSAITPGWTKWQIPEDGSPWLYAEVLINGSLFLRVDYNGTTDSYYAKTIQEIYLWLHTVKHLFPVAVPSPLYSLHVERTTGSYFWSFHKWKSGPQPYSGDHPHKLLAIIECQQFHQKVLDTKVKTWSHKKWTVPEDGVLLYQFVRPFESQGEEIRITRMTEYRAPGPTMCMSHPSYGWWRVQGCDADLKINDLIKAIQVAETLAK